MKLFATIQSERGKPVTKSGNEHINISILNEERKEIINLNVNEQGIYTLKVDTALVNVNDIPM